MLLRVYVKINNIKINVDKLVIIIVIILIDLKIFWMFKYHNFNVYLLIKDSIIIIILQKLLINIHLI